MEDEIKKRYLLVINDGWDRGNERWEANVELREELMRELKIETLTASAFEPWENLIGKFEPTYRHRILISPSQTEAWIIDIWDAKSWRLAASQLQKFQSLNLKQISTLDSLEEMRKPLQNSSISKKFGI